MVNKQFFRSITIKDKENGISRGESRPGCQAPVVVIVAVTAHRL